MLGHFCPQFGMSKMIAMEVDAPIENPSDGGDYRLQLSFDEGRIVTPWLQLKGRRSPLFPYIEVELTRSGDALTGVSASVKRMDRFDPQSAALGKQFQNLDEWPKLVLVKYSWRVRHENDVSMALFAIFASGGLFTIVMGLRAMAGYRKHLRMFFRDITREDPVSSSSIDRNAPKID